MAAKSPELKPVKIGSVFIPLTRISDGRVGFWDKIGGPRKWRVFRDEATARDEAEKLAIRCANGLAIRDELSTADVQAYRRALTTLEPLNVALTVAVDEYAHIHKIAEGRNLVDLVRIGVAHSKVPEITVNGALAELLARKKRRGVKFWRMKELSGALTAFVNAGFGNRVISRVPTSELDTYLDGLEVGARRRNNVRACLVTLWRFAKTNGGYIAEPLGETAAEKTEKALEDKGVITTYTPAEMRWWLENISEDFLPWLAAVAFSGVRTEEVCPDKENEKDQLRWEDFRWAKSYINIRPEVSKTGERRMCPMPANLAAWLAPYKNRTGYVVVPGARPDNEIRRLNRVSAALTKSHEAGKAVHACPGLKWKNNAHRHSFGSYRMAIIKNGPQLEYEMGNSKTMIRRHYDDRRDEDEAVAYFGIYPGEHAENVVVIGTEKPVDQLQIGYKNGLIAREA